MNNIPPQNILELSQQISDATVELWNQPDKEKFEEAKMNLLALSERYKIAYEEWQLQDTDMPEVL